MLLSARLLLDVNSVNSFRNVNGGLSIMETDGQTVYLQLIDTSLDRASEGFNPPGRRYMPAAGATLSVLLDSINDSKKVTRSATQPYASDPSIWSFSVLSGDGVRGTVNLRLTLTEGIKVTHGIVQPGLLIASLSGVQ